MDVIHRNRSPVNGNPAREPHNTWRRLALWACTAPAVAGVPASLAQAPTDSPAAQLEEITVTARKRDESLLEVPISISAVSSEQIAAYNLKDLSDLQRITPGFQISEAASFRRARDAFTLVMRGLNVGTSNDLQSAATIFVDGAPYVGGRPSSFQDVQRVEVLKGPQTAYFGRSTFTGAINLITKDPAREWGTTLIGEIAQFGSSDVALAIEGPVGQNAAFRFSGRNLVNGAQYSENVFNLPVGERKTQSGSATLLWTPAERVRLKVFAEYAEFHDSLSMVWDYPVNEFGNCNPSGGAARTWICGAPPSLDIAISRLGFPAVLDPRFMQTVVPLGIHQDLILGGGDHLFSGNTATHAILDYEFENGMTFNAIAAYHHTELQALEESTQDSAFGFYPCPLAQGCGRPFGQYVFLRERKQQDRSFEARVASSSESRIRWMIGGNVSRASLDGISIGEIPQNGPYVSRPNEIQKTQTVGVFGGLTLDVTDSLTANIDLRHQRDEVLVNPNVRAAAVREIEDTFESTTPRFSIQYQWDPSRMLYASYAEGVRPGTFNGALLARPQFIIDILEQQYGVLLKVEEEKLTQYELGVKGRFMDDRFQATLALYKGELTNQQISQSIFVNTPQLVTTITFINNAGQTDIQGIELEASFSATDRLRFDGSFGYYDTEIVADNCAQCVRIGGTLRSSEGKRVDATPVASGSIVGTYTAPLSGSREWFSRAEYFYTGKAYGDRMNLSVVDAFHRANLRTGLRTESFDLEAYLLNAFEDDTPTGAQLNTDLPSFGVALKIGLPEKRQWGLRGTYRF